MTETAEQISARENREREAKKLKLERDKRKFVRNCTAEQAHVRVLFEKAASVEIGHQISAHLDSWKAALQELVRVDDGLMELIDPTQSAANIATQEADIQKEYDQSKAELNKCVGTYKMLNESLRPPESSHSSSSSHSSTGPSLDTQYVDPFVKLRDVPLPIFDGKFSNFPDWYSEFCGVVDKNERFNDIQKMYLLKRSMGEGAQHHVKDLGSGGELYKPTLEGLYDSYFNRRRIIVEHFSSIVDLPQIKSLSLRESVNKVQRALRGLKVSGINVEATSPLVAYLISRKLPEKLRNDWEDSNRDNSVYPSFESLSSFLISRCFTYETASLTPSEKSSSSSGKIQVLKSAKPPAASQIERKSSSLVTTTPPYQPPRCVVCSKNHYLDKCEVFASKSVSERFDLVKTHRLCLKCFKSNHIVSKCNWTNCSVCNGRHHRLLHRENTMGIASDNSTSLVKNNGVASDLTPTSTNPPNLSSSNFVSNNVSHNLCALSSNKSVYLSTAVVNVQGSTRIEQGRVLFDQGSESTLITREFCTRLKLPIVKADHPTILVGINEKSVELSHAVRCVLKSRYTSFQIVIQAVVIDRIPYRVCRTELTEIASNFKYNFGESFDLPYDHVDILLGSEFVEFCLLERRYFIEGLCLRDSHFGFVVSGSRKSSFLIQKGNFCGLSNSELSDQFNRFYLLDEVPEVENEKSAEHKLIEAHFESTYHIDENSGKFVIRLPTKETISCLNGSFYKARSLLINSERRRSEITQKAYTDIFNEYLRFGHMSKVSNLPKSDGYFIPHHIVSKNSTTGISRRIVFNASFVDESGTSLNDHLLDGPVLQPKLSVNVIRFRDHIIALCADIHRMYRCILVHPEDRIYQQILFRFLLDEPIDIYELNTLTNGCRPAGYLAKKCLEKVGNSVILDEPTVANAILSEFYMDNLMSGSKCVTLALELQRKVHNILAKFGFPLCKYQSNSQELLDSIDPSLIEPLNQRNLGGDDFLYLLGLIWYPSSDLLSVIIRVETLPSIITKRVMLSDVSKIFDILGILSPVTIRAKLLLQELWKEGRGWDEPISNELCVEFVDYRNELSNLSSYSISRCYYLNDNVKIRQLIGFCDASTRAYCAVIYLRSIDDNGNVTISFVCAKTRIAPIKTIHIHRLELSAATLLANLINQIRKDLCIDDVYCFSDSQVTLSWINIDPLSLKVFVSNRVTKILSVTPKSKWFYVEGSTNPADLGTRGISASQFLSNNLWLAGPSWLCSEEDFLSFISVGFRPLKEIPEQKVEKVVLVISSITNPLLGVVKSCSSFYKTISIVAFCLRYVLNLRRRVLARKNATKDISSIELFQKMKSFDQVPVLTIEERDYAYYRLLYFVQSEFFERELRILSLGQEIDHKSRLFSLNVFLAPDGLLRVGGRLAASTFSYDCKFPIILSAKSLFLERYIGYLHQRYNHCTQSFLWNFVRSRYKVIGNLAAIIKKIVRRCIICTRFDARFACQIMGDLPPERIAIARPFSTVGVDFTGAINIKCVNHRIGKEVKVYAAFFVCFTTRAVHLDIVEDLTSEAFLNSFERFVSRRGLPSLVYSDNGTNFIGSKNILEQSQLHRYSVENRVRWKTIAPRSPHQGGLWESAVKAGKSLMMRSIGTQKLSLIELSTVLAKTEAILNSRPLCYRSKNDFVEPLTPGHFIIGSSLLESPVLDDGTVPLKQRYMLWRRIIDSFWTSWRHDYLNQLQHRVKWKARMNNLNVGDVVLVSSPNDSVMIWPMGIIDSVYPDRQGIIRNVSVRFANRSIRRTSVQKLVVLPAEGE